MEEKFQNMKKRMDELNNLDGMIKQIVSPFITTMLELPLQQEFRLPQVDSFDGSKDLLDHIESFKSLMNLQKTPDEIMCRGFPTTLEAVARVWFNKIPPLTIGCFNELGEAFVCHFIGGQRYRQPTLHLLSVR